MCLSVTLKNIKLFLKYLVNLLGIDPEKADDYAETSIKDIIKEYTASKGVEGKARAEEAAANEQTEEENGGPAENAGLKEQNAAGKAEQAGRQEGNAPVYTPASDKKAPNANAMQNNVAEENPEMPVIPETPEKPEVPVGGRP